MDAAICNQQKNIVVCGSFGCEHMLVELFEKWAEEGRSSKPDLGESLTVGSENVLDAARNLRVLRITVHGEAVTDIVNPHMSGDAAKSEEWEASVVIVWLNYLANLPDR